MQIIKTKRVIRNLSIDLRFSMEVPVWFVCYTWFLMGRQWELTCPSDLRDILALAYVSRVFDSVQKLQGLFVPVFVHFIAVVY